MKAGAPSRPYQQVARAEAKQRTREALFVAARDVFFSGPGEWERVSLDEIAARAGTTKQTLLRHFGSKEGLFDATADYWAGQAITQREEAPAGDVPAAIENLVGHYEAMGPGVLRLLSMAGRSDAVDEQLRRGRQLHYDWVDRVFAPWLGELAPAARKRRRAALIAACDVYTWSILSRDLGLSHSQTRQTLTESVERLLKEEE